MQILSIFLPKLRAVAFLPVLTLLTTFAAQGSKAQATNNIAEPTTEGVFYSIDTNGTLHPLENLVEQNPDTSARRSTSSIQGEHSNVRFPDNTALRLIVRLPSNNQPQILQWIGNQGQRQITYQRLENGKITLATGKLIHATTEHFGNSSFLVTWNLPLTPGEYCIDRTDGKSGVGCFGIDGSFSNSSSPGLNATITDWKSAVMKNLLTKFKMTETSNGKRTIVTPGTKLTLKKDNLGMFPIDRSMIMNTYKKGNIDHDMYMEFKKLKEQGIAKTLSTGDEVYLTAIMSDEKDKYGGIVLQFLSDTSAGGAYWGVLKIPFAKETQPDPDQIVATIEQVIEASPDPTTTEATTSSSVGISLTPGATSKLDIAGVHLGMTPDEAIEALRKFSNWPILKKRYEDPGARGKISAETYFSMKWGHTKISDISTFGFLGYSNDCNEKKAVKDKLLIAIVAANSNRITYAPNPFDITKNSPSQLVALGRHADRNKPFSRDELLTPSECFWGDPQQGIVLNPRPLEIAVYFSPTPGRERVIAISLTTSFQDFPLVEAVRSSAFSKYGQNLTATKIVSHGPEQTQTLSWRFDQKGDLYPESIYGNSDFERAIPSFYSFGMNMFNPRNGIGLDFTIFPHPNNPAIAKSYSVALFNEKAIIDFSAQERREIQAIVDKSVQDDLNKAKQAGAEIQF